MFFACWFFILSLFFPKSFSIDQNHWRMKIKPFLF
jgi:hypothetical protein